MSAGAFLTLEDAILDDNFPEADLALRRGRHIGREDGASFDFLVDALDRLEPFYKRFGCELVQRTEGYFYLLPSGDRMGRRHLSAGEMLVGQVLALMFLDPSTLQSGGVVARDLVLQRLANLVSTDVLMRTLNPQKKKYDERVAAEVVRTKVEDAVRKLQGLGFVDLLEDEVSVRLRPALMRFADPVRGLEDPADALAKLVAKGEVVLGEGAETPADDEEPAT